MVGQPLLISCFYFLASTMTLTWIVVAPSIVQYCHMLTQLIPLVLCNIPRVGTFAFSFLSVDIGNVSPVQDCEDLQVRNQALFPTLVPLIELLVCKYDRGDPSIL